MHEDHVWEALTLLVAQQLLKPFTSKDSTEMAQED
ncbi:MAG: hypothetical protein ACJAYX_004646 [Planctomycetota bacterium]